MITSFGYEHGNPPPADEVIDVRNLSHDLNSPDAKAVKQRMTDLVKAGKNIAVGCKHGQHRAVALARDVADSTNTSVWHRDRRRTSTVQAPKASTALVNALKRLQRAGQRRRRSVQGSHAADVPTQVGLCRFDYFV